MRNENVARIGNPYDYLDRNRPRKMVFYGRVSTEHEAQLDALKNQMQWYDDQAKYHPNWTVVDRYIDEGITGTQAKKRPAFLQMIEDAKLGKFDLIVTREVCRFARNTVDTLVTTRELKNIGVEVYFVEDNIWTMDGDGELRLTIMATLAQEESRKVSERVRAGQQISRENGTLYGCGNILGYDRVGDTYVINPEQAETVRLIYELYLKGEMGSMKIANELTRLGRLNASGKVKWTADNVLRILANQTYMGVMAYGKSYTNNYLDQKRFKNFDSSTYMCVEGNFEPIISKEDWEAVQKLKSKRTTQSLQTAIQTRKSNHKHGRQLSSDVWARKLRCSCGSSFRKNIWHKNKYSPDAYGYQCYNIRNNGSAKKRREAGEDDTGYCDQPMIAGWKFEVMGYKIMEAIWKERKSLIENICEIIKKNFENEKKAEINLSLLQSAIERLKKKKETLFDMRTEGEITKEEFVQQKDKLDREILDLETEYYEKSKLAEESKADEPCWDKIIAALNEMIDFSKPELDREVYEKFVSRIVPDGKNKFRWYLNLRGDEDYEVDAEVEGRKNRAVVTFDEVCDNLPGYGSVISINELRKTQTPDRIRTLHRQLSRDKGNLPQKADNFSLKLVDMCLTEDFAFEYIKTKSTVDHFKLSKWQNINIGVYI